MTMTRKVLICMVVTAFCGWASVAYAGGLNGLNLEKLIIPQGYVIDTSGTGGRSPDNFLSPGPTGTTTSKRIDQFPATGSPCAILKFPAPDSNWTASSDNNKIILNDLFRIEGASGACNFKLFETCTAETNASDATVITGYEGTSGTIVVAGGGYTTSAPLALYTQSVTAFPVFDKQTGVNCSGTACQDTMLTCAVCRDNTVASNCGVADVELWYAAVH